MPAPAASVGTNTASVGFATKRVKITQIDPSTNLVLAVDQLMVQVQAPYYTTRGKSRLPNVGETWLADQAYGYWTLCSFIGRSDDDFKILTSEISDFTPAVNGLIAAASVPDTWHTLAMTSNFTAYTASPGYGPLQYRKYPDNTVGLRGMVVPVAWPNNTNTLLANLPADITPAINQLLPGTAPAGFQASIRVLTNGELATASQSGSGVPLWVSLAGVRYTLDA